MAVTVTSSISGPYIPNGVTTVFAFDFKAASADEVDVYLDVGDTWELIPSANYTAAVDPDVEGGSVEFSFPPEGGIGLLYIASAPSFTREGQYTGEGPFTPKGLNNQFDKAAIRDLVLKRDLDRAIKVPMGEAGIGLPTSADRAGRFLLFGPDGEVMLSFGTGADAGLRGDLAANGGSLIMTGGGLLQAVLDAILAALALKLTPATLPGFIADAFSNLSASDSGQIRRRLFAASVEAMKANSLNYNGNCRISQQYGTALIADIGENDADGEELWVIDGHKVWAKGTARVSAQQVAVTDLPGFTHALKISVTTAQASIGTDFIRHVTVCENNRFLPLAWGTNKARDLVRYAWVKTSMAGTYDITILNGDRTVARGGTFTVDEPNSWQLVKVHFPAITFASSWDVNSVGFRCEIGLAGGGSPNLAAEVGHYVMFTGELFLPADYDPGITDTAPLMPNLQENLIACQRYYQKSYNMSTAPGTAASFAGSVNKIAEASVSVLTAGDVRFPVAMATIPTITTYSSNSGTSGKAYNSNTAADVNLTTQSAGANGFHAYLNGVAITAGHSLSFQYVADARIG